MNNEFSTFNLKLNQFDGPLDLLENLVREHKLDILNLDVNELTKQYLDFVNKNINKLQVDEASEYLLMASYLIELKSKKLLPVNDTANSDFEYERDKLVKRIIEYKQYKIVSQDLLSKQINRMEFIAKRPDDLENYQDEKNNTKIKLPNTVDLQKLLEAYKKAIEKYQFMLFTHSKIIVQELSVEIVQNEILDYLKSNQDKLISFSDYLSSIDQLKITFQYIITIFLALLELVRHNQINLLQKTFEDEIYFNNVINE